ncbi:STAS domain-containing protein [Kineococcus sp. SYSU DK003]|uniref:STAS domain-containing protein n=1 Tax=Kineococcus sp. SYSU DK003 TaxID=3383124 RepID=UPI003D7ECC69
MDFSVRQHADDDDVVTVEVSGDLDAETAGVFTCSMTTALARYRFVVLDLTRTTFLDCRGLACLLQAGRTARRRGIWLRAAGVDGAARIVFDAFDARCALGGDASVDEEVRRAAAQVAASSPPSNLTPA